MSARVSERVSASESVSERMSARMSEIERKRPFPLAPLTPTPRSLPLTYLHHVLDARICGVMSGEKRL